MSQKVFDRSTYVELIPSSGSLNEVVLCARIPSYLPDTTKGSRMPSRQDVIDEIPISLDLTCDLVRDIPFPLLVQFCEENTKPFIWRQLGVRNKLKASYTTIPVENYVLIVVKHN
jgi:hypothetical protein